MDKKLMEDVFQAYFDARQSKRNTHNQLKFEMDLEENLIVLAREIENRTYRVGRSTCFIVNKPLKREIFAADFRDRVVHHLIYNYVNANFERGFIEDCYSCRTGKGTGYGIKRLDHHIRSCSENYTQKAYILKLDLTGYFMSINRAKLLAIVEKKVNAFRVNNPKQKERELFLMREIIMNDPTDECVVKSKKSDWDGLPPTKSLFTQEKGCGLPIGNLTSQLFSNVYLNDFDHYVKRVLKTKHYGRYVDDFFLVEKDSRVLREKLNQIKVFLKDTYQLDVHPNKIYLQEVSKGVDFLGAFIKPHRRYIKKRTRKSFAESMRHINQQLKSDEVCMTELRKIQSRINSYLGHCGQFKAFKFKQAIIEKTINLNKWYSISPSKVRLKPHLFSINKSDLTQVDDHIY